MTINSRAKGKRSNGPNPSGICQCGCGERTSVAARSNRTYGHVRGTPVRFKPGHGHRGTKTKPLDSLYIVADRGYKTACWLWQGGEANGYGRTKWNGRMEVATHVFLERVGRPVPKGMHADHLCYIPACVNPDHLEVVTPTENVRRQRNVKLSVEAVAEIRAARAARLAAVPLTDAGKPRQRVAGGGELRRQLAARYGVTPTQIKHVWAGRSWAT